MARLPLPNDPSSVARARHLVARFAKDCGLPQSLVDLAVLSGSELVTNAIQHGRPPMTLRVTFAESTFRLEVHDCSDSEPGPGQPGIDDTRGRGLPIVGASAAQWGWDIDPDRRGKTVWFTVGP